MRHAYDFIKSSFFCNKGIIIIIIIIIIIVHSTKLLNSDWSRAVQFNPK